MFVCGSSCNDVQTWEVPPALTLTSASCSFSKLSSGISTLSRYGSSGSPLGGGSIGLRAGSKKRLHSIRMDSESYLLILFCPQTKMDRRTLLNNSIWAKPIMQQFLRETFLRFRSINPNSLTNFKNRLLCISVIVFLHFLLRTLNFPELCSELTLPFQQHACGARTQK